MREGMNKLRNKLRAQRTASILLVLILSCAVFYKIVFAVPPNPGHSLTSIGDATATYIPYGDGSNILTSDANLTWDGGTLFANGIVDATTQYNIASNFFGTQDSVLNNLRLGINSGLSLTTGSSNILIGKDAGILIDEGTTNIVIGVRAGENMSVGNANVIIGTSAGTAITGAQAADNNILIGTLSNTTAANSNGAIALGAGAFAGSNQFVVGSNSASITGVFIGNGITNTSPANVVINASGGSGTDIAGADLTIAGGIGTGTADGGDIIFQTTYI